MQKKEETALRQQSCFMAFGSNRGAEVDDEAEHLFSQQDTGGGAIFWYCLAT